MRIARGWCHTHYKRWQTHGDPLLGAKRVLSLACSVDDCGERTVSRDLCETHYGRWLRHGNTSTVLKAPAGTGYIHKQGYRRVRAGRNQARGEHILIVERVIGRGLKGDQQIHHVDQNKANNANTNLVVCPNAGYHQLLHKRQRALDACGNANFLKCCHCLQYDDPTKLVRQKKYSYHYVCRQQYQVQLRAKNAIAEGARC